MILNPKIVDNHSLIMINNEPISQVVSYKYVCLLIDNKLSWDVHVDNLCQKVKQKIYFLWRLRHFGVAQRIMLLFCCMLLCSIQNSNHFHLINVSVSRGLDTTTRKTLLFLWQLHCSTLLERTRLCDDVVSITVLASFVMP